MRASTRPLLTHLVRLFLLASAMAMPAKAVRAAEAYAAPEPASDSPGSQWIVVFPASSEFALRDQGVPIWERDEGIVLAGAGDDQIAALAALKIEPIVAVADDGAYIELLSHQEGFAAPRVLGTLAFPVSPSLDLYLVPADQSLEVLQEDVPALGDLASIRE